MGVLSGVVNIMARIIVRQSSPTAGSSVSSISDISSRPGSSVRSPVLSAPSAKFKQMIINNLFNYRESKFRKYELQILGPMPFEQKSIRRDSPDSRSGIGVFFRSLALEIQLGHFSHSYSAD